MTAKRSKSLQSDNDSSSNVVEKKKTGQTFAIVTSLTDGCDSGTSVVFGISSKTDYIPSVSGFCNYNKDIRVKWFAYPMSSDRYGTLDVNITIDSSTGTYCRKVDSDSESNINKFIKFLVMQELQDSELDELDESDYQKYSLADSWFIPHLANADNNMVVYITTDFIYKKFPPPRVRLDSTVAHSSEKTVNHMYNDEVVSSPAPQSSVPSKNTKASDSLTDCYE